MLTMIRRLFVLVALGALLMNCDDPKPGDGKSDTDTDTDTATTITTSVESFDATINGVEYTSGGITLPGCRYDFDVDEVPEGATDVVLNSCVLTFVLAGDISGRSQLTLTAPAGMTAVPDAPTIGDPAVEVVDFGGTEHVDGAWSFDCDDRGDCARIDGVTLQLSGEYTVTTGG